MTKFINGRISVVALLSVLFFVFLAGISLAVVIVISTRLDPGVRELELCLSSECFDLFGKTFKGAIDVVSATLSALVTLATVGGIVVALLVYNETVRANTLSNHISHLALFRSYVEKEIAKKNVLIEASVDFHAWYVLMFPESRMGNVVLSEEYVKAIHAVRDSILESNINASKAKGGSFRFVQHQEKTIKFLVAIGLKIKRQPRMEFFELEDEIYKLIDSVNGAFAAPKSMAPLPKRRYV